MTEIVLDPLKTTRNELTDPQEVRSLERRLAMDGISYKTRIVRTRRLGLRYFVDVFS